ncbi:MAG: DUF2127 domain-containing protein [Syntrophomonadaceae bacterium]
MNRIFTKDTIIDIGFYGGLAIKAINAVVEVLGGVMLMLITPDGLSQIIRQIALPELREDPTDPVMNYLLGLCQNFSSSTQASIAIYMLLHGATKIAIIWLLWKKILWAYPLAMGIFGLFIGYEIYGYMHSQSLLVLLIIMLDAAILTLIILEYIRLKKMQ